MKWLSAFPYLIAFALGGLAATTAVKFGKPTVEIPPCPQCPVCNCPPAVSLQNFDMDKLNNKRGTFTYSPQLHNVRVIIESKDSLLLKAILQRCD